MPSQTTTGSRIEQARNQLGLSVPQVARRIGVKRITLENWENDRSEPRAEKLLKLSGLLQVPMIWLLTGTTPKGLDSNFVAPETAKITQKLERALAMQQELAALLTDLSADVARLQRDLDEDEELAA